MDIYNGSSGYGHYKRARSDYPQSNMEENVPDSDDVRRKRPELPQNHVLLYTVLNPKYPITTEVIHTISSPFGNVLRIVVFRKKAVQAMVEFENVETAKKAKDALNGADIYSGCCTLKIEYAKPTKLNVHRNDSESWDYTVAYEDPRPPLLPEPKTTLNSHSGVVGYSMSEEPDIPVRMVGLRRLYDTRAALSVELNQAGAPVAATPVVMVYDLDPAKANCDRLFNLLCLYGNVVRIKFLKTKEGCAMVQMGDNYSVDRCITNLNGTRMIGDRVLSLGYSKQAKVSESGNRTFELLDGTPNFKDFSNSKNNRFTSMAAASKNRIQPPGKILHFFNTPMTISEEQMEQILDNALSLEGVRVTAVKLYPSREDARSSSGLVEFADVPDSVEAIMTCNHMPIKVQDSKFPYIMKLCFSSVKNINHAPRN